MIKVGIDMIPSDIEVDGFSSASIFMTLTVSPSSPWICSTIRQGGHLVAQKSTNGNPGASILDVINAARAAAAHSFITELPHGYDTLLGEKGRRLSGGQLQRISIARVLLRDAPMLVMDEPTTGLDPDSRREVMEPMEGLMSKRTVIAVTHDLDTVRRADLILVLEAGQVVERGTHEELLRKGARYARLYTGEGWVEREQGVGVEAGEGAQRPI